MNVYLADALRFQPGSHVPAFTVFGWLKRRLEIHRERHANKQHIKYLRTLDREILADMGVDIASLGETRASLASFSPRVIAIGLVTGNSLHAIPPQSR